MPVIIDLLENKVLGPPYKRGLIEGEEKGRAEGELKGELNLLRRQIQARFGPIPSFASERLAAMDSGELEAIGLRVLNAATLEDLFR